jgi:hypothetical protein
MMDDDVRDDEAAILLREEAERADRKRTLAELAAGALAMRGWTSSDRLYFYELLIARDPH